jgi:replication-associated recombination protein RarA
MNAAQLETTYTELANAIHRVGAEKAQLMLATLCLSLISEHKDNEAVMKAIAQAERLALDGAR